ncbi:amino acid permease [Rhodococcus pyridinivorans]|uniref:amino acid permease n=1 Tax=Rhodococcus pyridinivorans TaxID=103816 RepID=UPI0022853530|nr:amino acid permease [Rhodococcus pyridinivorans]WAL49202.1 amino acid permease [Rhodococcus pyridinivorans]
MAWLMLGVLALVGVVAGVVVPRRARLGSAPGFPWFWVAFPATCIVIATAIGVFAWPQVLTGSGSYWWEPPTANRPGVQFLSNEQYQRFATLRRWRWVLPVASLVGIGWCVWAWRRRRV